MALDRDKIQQVEQRLKQLQGPTVSATEQADPKQSQGFLGDTYRSLVTGTQRIPEIATGVTDIGAGLYGGAVRSVAQLGGASEETIGKIDSIFDRPFDRATDWVGEKTGFTPGEWADEGSQYYSPQMQADQAATQQATQENITDRWQAGDKWGAVRGVAPTALEYIKNPRAIQALVGESLPQTVVGGLAGGAIRAGAGRAAAATTIAKGPATKVGQFTSVAGAQPAYRMSLPTAAGVGEGLLIAGNIMNEIDNDTDYAKAALASVFGGAFGAAVGMGGAALAGRAGLVDIDAAVAGRALGAGIREAGTEARSWPVRIVGGSLLEGLQEVPQESMEQIAQNWAEGNPILDGVLETVAPALLAGGAMGAGANILAPGTGREYEGPDDLFGDPASLSKESTEPGPNALSEFETSDLIQSYKVYSDVAREAIKNPEAVKRATDVMEQIQTELRSRDVPDAALNLEVAQARYAQLIRQLPMIQRKYEETLATDPAKAAQIARNYQTKRAELETIFATYGRKAARGETAVVGRFIKTALGNSEQVNKIMYKDDGTLRKNAEEAIGNAKQLSAEQLAYIYQNDTGTAKTAKDIAEVAIARLRVGRMDPAQREALAKQYEASLPTKTKKATAAGTSTADTAAAARERLKQFDASAARIYQGKPLSAAHQAKRDELVKAAGAAAPKPKVAAKGPTDLTQFQTTTAAVPAAPAAAVNPVVELQAQVLERYQGLSQTKQARVDKALGVTDDIDAFDAIRNDLDYADEVIAALRRNEGIPPRPEQVQAQEQAAAEKAFDRELLDQDIQKNVASLPPVQAQDYQTLLDVLLDKNAGRVIPNIAVEIAERTQGNRTAPRDKSSVRESLQRAFANIRKGLRDDAQTRRLDEIYDGYLIAERAEETSLGGTVETDVSALAEDARITPLSKGEAIDTGAVGAEELAQGNLSFRDSAGQSKINIAAANEQYKKLENLLKKIDARIAQDMQRYQNARNNIPNKNGRVENVATIQKAIAEQQARRDAFEAQRAELAPFVEAAQQQAQAEALVREAEVVRENQTAAERRVQEMIGAIVMELESPRGQQAGQVWDADVQPQLNAGPTWTQIISTDVQAARFWLEFYALASTNQLPADFTLARAVRDTMKAFNDENGRVSLAQAREIVASAPAEPEVTRAPAERVQRPVQRSQRRRASPAAAAPAEARPADGVATGDQDQATERRQDFNRRAYIEGLTPEQLEREIFISPKTGLPNARAYERAQEANPAPILASIDVDSLKWINDNMGHVTGGDQLLAAVGRAFAEETNNAHHMSGDEFTLRAWSMAEAQQVMERVSARLADADITVEMPDGTIVTKAGINIGYGLGETFNAADAALIESKAAREAAGERAGRGETPRGVVTSPAARVADRGRAPATETEVTPNAQTVRENAGRPAEPRGATQEGQADRGGNVQQNAQAQRKAGNAQAQVGALLGTAKNTKPYAWERSATAAQTSKRKAGIETEIETIDGKLWLRVVAAPTEADLNARVDQIRELAGQLNQKTRKRYENMTNVVALDLDKKRNLREKLVEYDKIIARLTNAVRGQAANQAAAEAFAAQQAVEQEVGVGLTEETSDQLDASEALTNLTNTIYDSQLDAWADEQADPDAAREELEALRDTLLSGSVEDVVKAYSDFKARNKIVFSLDTVPRPMDAVSADKLRAQLLKKFRVTRGFDQVVTIVDNVSELPDRQRVDAETVMAKDGLPYAMYDPDTRHVYMIASHISPKDAFSKLLHELGVHAGLPSILSPKQMRRLIHRIDKWAKSKGTAPENVIARRAKDRMANATDKAGDQISEELLAYFVEEAVDAGIDPYGTSKLSTSLREFFNFILEVVNDIMDRFNLPQLDALTADDVVNLAYYAAQMRLYRHNPIWRSDLEERIDGLRKVANKAGEVKFTVAETWINGQIKNGNIKKAEVEAAGLFDFIAMLEAQDYGDSVPVDVIKEYEAGGVVVEESVSDPYSTREQLQNRINSLFKDANAALELLKPLYDELDALDQRRTDLVNKRGEIERAQGRTEAVRQLDFEIVRLYHEQQSKQAELEQQEEALSGDIVREIGTLQDQIGRTSTYIGNTLERDFNLDSYRELKLKLPGPKQFTSGHFGGEPNILAWVRFNTRVDGTGNQVLFIEEIQSDWAQQTRDFMFATDEEFEAHKAKLEKQLEEAWAAYQKAEEVYVQTKNTEALNALQSKLDERQRLQSRVAHVHSTARMDPAPFVQDTQAWQGLAARRMVRWAAEEGFDRIAWTTGEQQAARWGGDDRLIPVYDKQVPKAFQKAIRAMGGDAKLETITLPGEQEFIVRDEYGRTQRDQITDRTEAEEIVSAHPGWRYSEIVAGDLQQPAITISDAVKETAIEKGPALFSVAANPVIRQLPKPAQRWWTDLKDKLLKAANVTMFSRDVVDWANKHGLTAAKAYFQSLTEKLSIRDRKLVQLQKIVAPSAKWDHKERTRVNNFLYKSAYREEWGFAPDWMEQHDFDPESRTAKDYQTLLQSFPKNRRAEVANVVQGMFRQAHQSHSELQAHIRGEIEASYKRLMADANTPARRKQKQAEMENALREHDTKQRGFRNAYLPLRRWGEWAVIWKSPDLISAEKTGDRARIRQLKGDFNHYAVLFEENERTALATRERLQNHIRANTAFKEAVVFEPFPRARQKEMLNEEIPFDVINNLKQMVDMGPDVTKTVRDSVMNALDKMYISALAETSSRKSELERLSVMGANKDMIRAFVEQGTGIAALSAALDTNATTRDLIGEMKQQAMEAGPQRKQRMMAFNELMARHALAMTYQEHPIQSGIMGFTSVWMLMSNPAYYIQNTTQPFMLTYPMLAARFGANRAMAKMVQAYPKILKLHRATKDGGLLDPELLEQIERDPSKKQLFEDLQLRGLLDVGIAMELGTFKDAKSGIGRTAHWTHTKMVGAVRTVELFNRGVTAMVAHDLELARLRKTAPTWTDARRMLEAREYAMDLVSQSQGDYSLTNAPRLISKIPAGRLVTQFRKFQLIQIGLLTRTVYNAFKGATPAQRAMARRQFGHLMMMHAAVGGMLGLPVPALIWWAVAKGLGDEDEPKNIELLLRREIGDKATADLLLRGIPAYMGVDASTRLGMGMTFSLLPFVDIKPTRDGALVAMAAALGPWTTALARGVDGFGQMREGNVLAGLAQLQPALLMNAIRAYENHTAGVLNRRGEILMTPDELGYLELVTQGLGWPSKKLSDRHLIRGMVYDVEQHFNKRTGRIKREYIEAWDTGDSVRMQQAMDEWLRLQEMRVNYKVGTWQPMRNLTRALLERDKRERQTIEGVMYDTGTQGFVEDMFM